MESRNVDLKKVKLKENKVPAKFVPIYAGEVFLVGLLEVDA